MIRASARANKTGVTYMDKDFRAANDTSECY